MKRKDRKNGTLMYTTIGHGRNEEVTEKRAMEEEDD